MKRAQAVKNYLVKKGIAEDRIETIGYGPDRPIGDNKRTRGRNLNRRIEFELLPGPEVMTDGALGP
jgi:outer membrane protein OmpA-like peptidoglycan-associated protein